MFFFKKYAIFSKCNFKNSDIVGTAKREYKRITMKKITLNSLLMSIALLSCKAVEDSSEVNHARRTNSNSKKIFFKTNDVLIQELNKDDKINVSCAKKESKAKYEEATTSSLLSEKKSKKLCKRYKSKVMHLNDKHTVKLKNLGKAEARSDKHNQIEILVTDLIDLRKGNLSEAELLNCMFYNKSESLLSIGNTNFKTDRNTNTITLNNKELENDFKEINYMQCEVKNAEIEGQEMENLSLRFSVKIEQYKNDGEILKYLETQLSTLKHEVEKERVLSYSDALQYQSLFDARISIEKAIKLIDKNNEKKLGLGTYKADICSILQTETHSSLEKIKDENDNTLYLFNKIEDILEHTEC